MVCLELRGKIRKAVEEKEVINLLEEEVDGNVNHRTSAQFNFPDSLGHVCHASLAR